MVLEINRPHFAGGRVAASSALPGSSALAPAGLLRSLARASERDAQPGERRVGIRRGHGGAVSPGAADSPLGGNTKQLTVEKAGEAGNDFCCCRNACIVDRAWPGSHGLGRSSRECAGTKAKDPGRGGRWRSRCAVCFCSTAVSPTGARLGTAAGPHPTRGAAAIACAAKRSHSGSERYYDRNDEAHWC